MKKFLIICSIIIILWMFLPFLQYYSVFSINSIASESFDTKKIVLFLITFIISSWFISIWYSNKVKVSIIWVLWSMFYIYIYYHLFYFVFENKDSFSFLARNDSAIDFILYTLNQLSNSISIWFYVILIWFIWNSIWVLWIIYKTYKSIYTFFKNINNFLILKANPNAIIRDDWMRMYKKSNIAWEQHEIENNTNIENKEKYNEIIEEDDLNFIWSNQKNKLKIIWVFILWNIFWTIILSFIWGELIGIVTKETPNIQSWLIIWVLVIIASLNVFLVNNYVYSFINRKKLIKIIWWVFVLLYIFVIYYNYTIWISSF